LPEKARHEFKSQPGKAGFRVSGSLLLDDFPPLLDKLDQHLATIAQTVAFLELINESDGLARQRNDKLMLSLRGKPAPVGAILVGDGMFGRLLHGPPLLSA
jgi:hypothetical protein